MSRPPPSPAGTLLRAPRAGVDVPGADGGSVRADTRERTGLRSVTLEIDAGDQLVVFSRRALGTDPETVAALIGAFAPQLP